MIFSMKLSTSSFCLIKPFALWTRAIRYLLCERSVASHTTIKSDVQYKCEG